MCEYNKSGCRKCKYSIVEDGFTVACQLEEEKESKIEAMAKLYTENEEDV